MSDSIVCHISPAGGIDDRIAQFLDNGYTKEYIGTLRGLYDMDNKEPLISPLVEDSDIKGTDFLQVVDKLMTYKNSQVQRHQAEMKNSQAHMAKTFNQLYKVPGWNEATRRNRINMVAAEFTAEVSRRVAAADKAGTPKTREQIINGYKVNGQKFDGQLSIFESVFDRLVNKFNEAREVMADVEGLSEEELAGLDAEDKAVVENAKHIIEEYPKILQNWSALCTFARISLRDTESLKLGQTLEYASPTSPDNFTMDSPLEDTYDLEESVREAWMTHQSETSAFGSLGSEVRRFLSTIADVDAEGKKRTDDLGYTVKMDPIETHQYLAEILRGITSESGMIRKLRSLSDSDPKVKAIFDALAKASKADLSKSIDDTNKPRNPVILTQLLEDMHKNMVPYTALLARIKDGIKQVYVKVLNKQANPLQDEFVLRMQLHQPLDALSVYDEQGNVNWENMAQWYAESRNLLPAPDKKNVDSKNIFESKQEYGKGGTGFWSSNYSKAQRIDYMKRVARTLGIPMTDKAARRIYNDATLRKTFLTAMQEFRTETRNSLGNDVKRAFDTIIKYNGIMPSVNAGFTVEQREEYLNALNTLKNQNVSYDTFLSNTYGSNQGKSKGAGNERISRALDVLAKVSSNLKTERRVSWFDRKGKANSRYSDRTPSYMGDLVDKIHEFVNEGDAQGLKDFIMDKWGQSSFFYDKQAGRFLNKWLQELYDSIRTDTKGNTIINQDALAKVFEFDEFLGSNIDKQVNIFENFTEKQHAEAMIKQFLQLRDQNKKSSLAKYPCFILGDSGAQMFFTARRYSQEEIMDGLKDVFRQEIERIKYVKATNDVLEKGGYKTIDNFSQTSDEFTMLTFLNKDFENGRYWKILTGNEQMTDAELKTMSKEQAMEEAVGALGTDALTDVLQQYMDDALANFKNKLVSVGILTESKGEGEVIKYTDSKNYFSGNLDVYGKDVEKMVEDFFWNTKYATIEQLQMFTVDPAFYDHRYPIKDLQKRYKEIYAPGKGVSLEARDYNGNLFMDRPYERAVYFDDIAVSSEDVNPQFMKLMEKTFGENSDIVKAYKKNTLTDGQGYRTLESYRAVRGMAGEWTIPMENAYQRIQEIRKSGQQLTESDIQELAKLAVIFQPIKPYLYTLEKLQINDEGDMALIPVQHKYAEIVLIPELMQEGKLRDMAIWMENHVDEEGKAAPIDLVASTKCVKVGSFGSVALKGANTTESINNVLDNAYVHNLSWGDYRIQSGVPEHLNHAQLFGTQIRKLILAGINKDKNYDYLSNVFGKTDDPRGPKVYLPGMGNVHLSGSNLISFYNCLIMGNLFDSYNQFASQSTTNQALSDKMIQNIISNANQSEDNAFAFSIIDEGENKGEFVVPLGEPGMEHDASALLFSIFKKMVNKQRIKGGSAVQASALGLSGYEESGDLFEVVSPDGENVLYDEIEMPWNVSFTAATGKNVPLRFEDWCNTDGTLKMSDKIVYGDDALEYLSWPVSGRDKFGRAKDPSQGYYVPLIETKYKGILDIIAYRIPTERDYSMVNAKVFRFSNPLAGGTMKVPSSRTTTAGFDFDIDKLYFFMREFAQTHLSEKDIEDIWNGIYEEHPQWKEALREARDNDKLGEKLFGPIAAMFKDNMSGLGEMNQQAKAKDRLYYYWESAGLEGTPEEAFNKYLENHRKDYPIFDTYNPEISPLENTRVARNNMLMDLMRQRLMDKETLKARYTPGGFENNRDAALRQRVLQFADIKDITTDGHIDWSKVDAYVESINKGERKDPEPEYDASDPTAILVYNQQNQVAGKLIGIFANQNTNHVYASTLHELALREPLSFGNHWQKGLFDMLHAPAGIDVDTNVAEYLAASVDAVKDPVLNFLNLNLVTADAGALLARIGYTPQEIGLLFNQPIIKELCNYAANENVSTDVAITEMLKKYGGKDASMKKILFKAENVSTDRLANNVLQDREEGNKSNEFKQGQLQVLWLFNELMADTADVNSFVQCTRFTAANSIGSTWGEQIAKEERVSNFVDRYADNDEESMSGQRLVFELFDPESVGSLRLLHSGEGTVTETNQGILNIDEKLLDLSPEEYMAQMSRNPLAFEQCMMDLTRKATKNLFSKHFPYYTQLYTNMRDVMRRLTKFGNLDADTANSLHREFIVYLLGKQRGSQFDGEAPSGYYFDGVSLTNREYFLLYYPKLMYGLRQMGDFANVPFFNAITFTGNADPALTDKPVEMQIQGMGGLQSRATSTLSEMWAEAVNSDLVVNGISVSEMAKNFYFYNFYKLGYNFHPTSSMSLAPTFLKLGLRVNTQTEEKGYIDFIRDVIDGKINYGSNDLVNFAKQYILNHLDNNKLVFTPKGNARTVVANKAYSEAQQGWNTSFTISQKELGRDTGKLFLLNDETLQKGEVAYRPVIALERDGVTKYYMADGNGDRFNVTSAADGTMTYRQVFAQGSKGQRIQYFGNSEYEAFQRNGGLFTQSQANQTQEKVAAEQAPAPAESAAEESAVDMEGAEVEASSVGPDINVADMFTDAEWKQMIKAFREKYPSEGQGIHDNDIKAWLSSAATDAGALTILNELATRIGKGEKMKTINEKGNEIDVCK